MHRRPRGLTLIELLIAVAIVAILLGIALPSYNAFMEGARAGAARTALLSSLTTTATRAGISGRHAVLCASRDGSSCSGDPNWSTGWIAFLDANENRSHDDGETLVLVQDALPGKVRLHSTRGRTRLVFQGNGGNAGSNVTFTLCDGRGAAKAQTLVINNAGRMRYGTPSAAAIAATCPG